MPNTFTLGDVPAEIHVHGLMIECFPKMNKGKEKVKEKEKGKVKVKARKEKEKEKERKAMVKDMAKMHIPIPNGIHGNQLTIKAKEAKVIKEKEKEKENENGGTTGPIQDTMLTANGLRRNGLSM